MIELRNINKFYGKNQVLKGINLSIKKGYPLAIVGHNGAGKSTILKIILSILKAENGEVSLPDCINRIGYLPEERGVYRNETVLTHLKYFSELSGLKLSNKDLDNYLAKFEILMYKDFKLKDLSKGNAQKLQLALCFLGNPDLLILDEPFSGLDPLNRKVLSNILKEGSSSRYTIFSSHQMEQIERYCSDILILKNGEVRYFGSIEDLKASHIAKRKLAISYRDESGKKIYEKLAIDSSLDKWLIDKGVNNIINLSYGYPSLEEIYFDIMKGDGV